MTYKFIKIQKKATTDEKQPKGFWLFEPQSERQILEHWEKYANATIREGVKILTEKMFSGTKGHFRNDFEQAVETWQTLTGNGLLNSMAHIEQEALKSRMQSFREGKQTYLNRSIQVVTLDSRFTEIVNTTERAVLTYPDEDGPTIDDVRFIVWDDGIHFYAKIGKIYIVDEQGKQKWNTKQEAEAAARWYIEKNW